MTGGVASLFKTNGVEWVKGRGRFTGPNTIAVEGAEDVTFKSAIVATGSFPLMPPIDGLDSPRCVDSTALLAQTEIPRRLVILGGGIIGCEFASIFQRFGTEVTVIEMLETLIPQETPMPRRSSRSSSASAGSPSSSQCTGVQDDGSQLTVYWRRRERAGRSDAGLGRPPARLSTVSTRGDRRRARQAQGIATDEHRRTTVRMSTPSATAPATGSSRTRRSAKARSRPRTPAATRRRSASRATADLPDPEIAGVGLTRRRRAAARATSRWGSSLGGDARAGCRRHGRLGQVDPRDEVPSCWHVMVAARDRSDRSRHRGIDAEATVETVADGMTGIGLRGDQGSRPRRARPRDPLPEQEEGPAQA